MPIKKVIHSRMPVKIWTDDVDDASIDQLRNIGNMPFIHKHVAAMPDVHLGKGATIGSVIATKGAIIPAAVGVDLGCFVGETKIPLLDGSQRTLSDLVNERDPFWVYSIDKKQRVVPGRAVCVQTRADAELMRVVVSGGDEIICTPDHEFMLNDGTYCKAESLSFNDSLMPLYRKWQTRDGYESVSNGKGNSRQTHVMVFEEITGPVLSGYVVHHINHVHFDNRPDNLEVMTAKAHSEHHRATGNKFKNHDKEFQIARRAGIERSKNDPTITALRARVGTENITKFMAEKRSEFLESVKSNGARGAPALAKFNISPRSCGDCGYVAKNPASLRWHKEREHACNHKVISVSRIPRRDAVYCLQVEGHNNFALAAGVFVHNCGMMAVKTSLTANDLPDNLHSLRCDIESAIPHGRTNNGGAGDKGGWSDVCIPYTVNSAFSLIEGEYTKIISKHPKAKGYNTWQHMGTLGTGNHFIEICLDESNHVWAMLHSGSRGAGNRIGTYFIEKAKEEMQRYYIDQYLPDQDLSYLVEHSELFDDYVSAVEWAQKFAELNRQVMMDRVLSVMTEHFGMFECIDLAINCHHNYISRENHFNSNVIVTRKGAIRARDGEYGIIPGSMGAKSYIVRGKGNAESFNSCSHGAGRRMGRKEAERQFTVEDLIAQTIGIECPKDQERVDEIPAAYKDIDVVMENQSDLVEIVHTLKQVVNIKG